MERLDRGFYAGLLIQACIMIPFTFLFSFLGKYFMYLFMTEQSAAAVDIGVMFLRIVTPFYAMLIVKVIGDAVLRGTGNIMQFTISTFADLLVRVVLSFFLSDIFGPTGIWMSWPIGWATGTVVSQIFYWRKPWKTKRLLQ